MRERSQKAKACHGVRRHFADSSRLYDGCMEDVARVTRKGGVKEGCAKKNCKGKGSRGEGRDIHSMRGTGRGALTQKVQVNSALATL